MNLSLIGSIFTIALGPVLNLLVLVWRFLDGIHLPGAIGFAIILLTLIIRLVLWPFMSSQIKSARKMAELKPHIDALKAKHKNDKQAFTVAQMALYKEHGFNPAGGCLPTVVQLFVLIGLNQSVFALVDPNGLNKVNGYLYPFVPKLSFLPNLDFFGINLAVKPAEFGHVGYWLLLVPLITAVLQLVQARMMSVPPVKTYPGDSPKEKKEKEDVDDTMMAMQSQMLYMMPVMIGYFAFQYPLALALYWNTMTIIGIIQQYKISGLGGLASWTKFFTR